jgi:hypothetical protein
LENIVTGSVKVNIGYLEVIWSSWRYQTKNLLGLSGICELVNVTATWNVPGAFWEKMKKKFLLGLSGKQIPMDFSKGRSFPKLVDGKRSVGAQIVEHAIYESQWVVFKRVYVITSLESSKKVLIESSLELSAFAEKIMDGVMDDSKESGTLESPIRREVVERIFGFYQYWDDACWALPLEEFIPWGSDQKLDK